MTKTCPNCRKENLNSAKFCEGCGTSLNDAKDITGTTKKSKQKNIFDQMKDWWNERSTKGKGVTGLTACCLGLLLVVGVSGLISPDENLADLELTDAAAIYDGDGKYNMEISNNTTDLVINGKTEAGAKVNVTSSELSLNEQKVEVGSDNTFHYKVKIPANVNEVTIKFEASAPNKTDSYIELTIKRPSTEVSNPVTTTPVETEAQYKASCKTISYKQLEKNPDKYTGQRAKFTGSIFQIQESGDFTSILLDVNGYDNISVLYDGTTSAVEDSTVTVYGEIMGSYTYESVAGYQITVPQMNAKYITVSG